jgi:heme/copper-type cytochrome/quinol oxidase subunit 2
MNKLVLLSVVVLASCVAQPPDTGETAPSSSSGAAGGFVMSSVYSEESASMMASSKASSKSRSALRKIPVIASGASFVPEIMTVEKGERVQLLISGEMSFGFAIPQLRIYEHVVPRRSTAIDLPTDVEGMFEYICSYGCGSGATLMRGRIIVD